MSDYIRRLGHLIFSHQFSAWELIWGFLIAVAAKEGDWFMAVVIFLFAPLISSIVKLTLEAQSDTTR